MHSKEMNSFLTNIWFNTYCFKIHVSQSSGTGTAYTLEYISSASVISGVVFLNLEFSVQSFVDCCQTFCPLRFGHLIVCPSSICGFWLHPLYIQTFGPNLMVLYVMFSVEATQVHNFNFTYYYKCICFVKKSLKIRKG